MMKTANPEIILQVRSTQVVVGSLLFSGLLFFSVTLFSFDNHFSTLLAKEADMGDTTITAQKVLPALTRITLGTKQETLFVVSTRPLENGMTVLQLDQVLAYSYPIGESVQRYRPPILRKLLLPLWITTSVLILMYLGIPVILVKRSLKRISSRVPSPNDGDLKSPAPVTLRSIYQKQVMASAITAEAGVFLNLTGYLWTDHASALYSAVVMMSLLIVCFPTVRRAQHWIHQRNQLP